MSKTKTIYLYRGDSLSDILEKLKAEGIKREDYSKVILEMKTVSCCGGHEEGEYCYCPDSYDDIRFEWKDKK
jgi:hypothetical protein